MALTDEIARTQPRSRLGCFSALIATTAVASDDLVSVTIPAIDPAVQWGPARFVTGGGATLPERGDIALVIFDESHTPYVIGWWPSA